MDSNRARRRPPWSARRAITFGTSPATSPHDLCGSRRSARRGDLDAVPLIRSVARAALRAARAARTRTSPLMVGRQDEIVPDRQVEEQPCLALFRHQRDAARAAARGEAAATANRSAHRAHRAHGCEMVEAPRAGSDRRTTDDLPVPDRHRQFVKTDDARGLDGEPRLADSRPSLEPRLHGAAVAPTMRAMCVRRDAAAPHVSRCAARSTVMLSPRRKTSGHRCDRRQRDSAGLELLQHGRQVFRPVGTDVSLVEDGIAT